MRVLLINPPFSALKGILEVGAPLGLPYLTSYLSQNKIECKHLNLDQVSDGKTIRAHDIGGAEIENNYRRNLKNDNFAGWKRLKDELQDYKPQLIGITCTTSSYDSAIKTANIVRLLLPKAEIVVGGPHATAEYENIDPVFDHIVKGEGELPLLNLIQKGDCSSQTVKNLDDLPSPQRFYELLRHKESHMAVITSRGCNNRCKYCAASFLWPRFRVRSVENVMEEIREGIRIHKVGKLGFHDANFNFSKKRVMEICEAMIKEKFNLEWTFVGNLNVIDDEVCSLLKRSGCVKILAGVETGDQDMMNRLNKKLTIDEIRTSVKTLHRHGVMCSAFVMYGLPEQSIRSMKKTNQLLRSVAFDDVWHSMYFPIPGSEMAKDLDVSYRNTTFNSYRSCFDYHNDDPRFKKVVRKLMGITKRRRIMSSLLPLRAWRYREYFVRKAWMWLNTYGFTELDNGKHIKKKAFALVLFINTVFVVIFILFSILF